jgi:hypothetical protein
MVSPLGNPNLSAVDGPKFVARPGLVILAGA